MARNRSIRFRKLRKSKEPMDIDITSLLDILVILLVFLLKAYSSNNIIISIPKGITIPDSTSQSFNNAGVIIQVSKEKIFVDSQEVVDYFTNPEGLEIYGDGGRLVTPLFDRLVQVREEIELVKQQANIEKEFSGIVNLVVDKEIKYIEVKRVLYTAAQAGFKSYKFVVLSQEQM